MKQVHSVTKHPEPSHGLPAEGFCKQVILPQDATAEQQSHEYLDRKPWEAAEVVHGHVEGTYKRQKSHQWAVPPAQEWRDQGKPSPGMKHMGQRHPQADRREGDVQDLKTAEPHDP